jgi:hypothetical protein
VSDFTSVTSVTSGQGWPNVAFVLDALEQALYDLQPERLIHAGIEALVDSKEIS